MDMNEVPCREAASIFFGSEKTLKYVEKYVYSYICIPVLYMLQFCS